MPSPHHTADRLVAMRTLVADVLGCYVARSPKQLLSLYDASMHPTLRFIDPFAVAAPLPEARLQFYALQKLFDKVTAGEPTNLKIIETDAGGGSAASSSSSTIAFHCEFEYTWARTSSFSRWLLPEKTIVESMVELIIDDETGKVLEHHDAWRKPVVPNLPMLARRANVALSNAVMRFLGWEKELLREAGAVTHDQEPLKAEGSKLE